jgi:hypothetical protein
MKAGGKAERRLVEARERDLAALREPEHERVEQRGITGSVDDGAVGAMRIGD